MEELKTPKCPFEINQGKNTWLNKIICNCEKKRVCLYGHYLYEMSILSLYEPKDLPKLDNMVSQMIPNDQTIFGFPYSSNLRRIVVLMQQMDVRCHRKRFVKNIIHRVWFSDMV